MMWKNYFEEFAVALKHFLTEGRCLSNLPLAS